MFEDMLGGFEDLLNNEPEKTNDSIPETPVTLAQDSWNDVGEPWSVKSELFNNDDSPRLWEV